MTPPIRRPIHTVLVANRGEIALRVIRACGETGRRSVAIYTDLDREAPHVRAADDAVHVRSYLDIEAVVAAARRPTPTRCTRATASSPSAPRSRRRSRRPRSGSWAPRPP